MPPGTGPDMRSAAPRAAARRRGSTPECRRMLRPGQIAEPERLTDRAPVDCEDERREGHPGEPAGIEWRKTQDQKETGKSRKGRSPQSPKSSRSKFIRVVRLGRLGNLGRLRRLGYSSLPW